MLDIKHYANGVWQNNEGKDWTNLQYAKEKDGHNASISLTDETPKKIYYNFDIQEEGVINKSTFCLSLPTFPSNYYRPTVRFFDGSKFGNNAVNVTEPLKTVITPDKVGKVEGTTEDDSVSYRESNNVEVNYYDFNDITDEQLNHLIVEVVFGKPLNSDKLELNIGWARMELLYDDSQFNSSIIVEHGMTSPYIIELPNHEIVQTVTLSNYSNRNRYLYFNMLVPDDMALMYYDTADFIAEKKCYRVMVEANSYVEVHYRYKVDVLKSYQCQSVLYLADDTTTVYNTANWGVILCEGTTPMTDNLELLPSEIHYDCLDEQYIDVVYSCDYKNTRNIIVLNLEGYTDFDNVFKIDSEQEFNIENIYYTDNKITVYLKESGAFYCKFRMYTNPQSPSGYDKQIVQKTIEFIEEDSGLIHYGIFYIYPPKGHTLLLQADIRKYNSPQRVSFYFGNKNSHVLRARASNRNFFNPINGSDNVIIDELIKYIGPVVLERSHSKDATASVSNTLIEDVFENRKYMGKKGDIKEKITLPLRTTPAKVKTLTELVKLDKPVGIDLAPHLPDGDPLNHRGWAVLYDVSNIKEVNRQLYDCDIGVSYLMHDLNTVFRITKGNPVSSLTPPFYLSTKHEYTQSLLKLFNLNNYTFFDDVNYNTLEEPKYIGKYSIEENNSLIFTTQDKVSDYHNYNFKWRNILPVLMSEDHDLNWSMSVSLMDLINNRKLVEYSYYNFHHGVNGKVKNMCDVLVRILNDDETVSTKYYNNMSLLLNDLTPLIGGIKRKITITGSNDDEYTIKVVDVYNNPVVDHNIEVTVRNTVTNVVYNYQYLTDRFGKVYISKDLPDGHYSVKAVMNEDDVYEGGYYDGSFDVSMAKTVTYILIGDNYKFYDVDETCPVTLYDKEGSPLAGERLFYSFKGVNDLYYHGEQYLVTDNNGTVNVPLINNTGNYWFKVTFKGTSNYASSVAEKEIYVSFKKGQTVIIESNDLTYLAGHENRQFSIVLKNSAGTPLSNQDILFNIYNSTQSFLRNTKTDTNGVAVVNLRLPSGLWNVDTVYKGVKDIFVPCIVTNDITVTSNNKLETILVGANNLISNVTDTDYNVTLKSNDVILKNKPVRFLVRTKDSSKTTLFDGVVYTDDTGKAYLPFRYGEQSTVHVTTVFEGDNTYSSYVLKQFVNYELPSTKNNTVLTVEAVTNDDYSFKATLKSKEGTLLNAKDIKVLLSQDFLYLNDIEPHTYTTDNNGVAWIPRVDGGNYKVNASFVGDINYNWSSDYKKLDATDTTNLKDVVLDVTLTGTYTENHFLNGVGTLKDSDGNSIKNTVITLYNSDGLNDFTITDTDGEFEFEHYVKGNTIKFFSETDAYHKDLNVTKTITTIASTDKSNTLTTTVSRPSDNYHEMDLLLHNSTESDYVQNGDYYSVHLYNFNTSEEIYFDINSIDNSTSSKLTFALDKGHWIYTVHGFGNTGYEDNFNLGYSDVPTALIDMKGATDQYNKYYCTVDEKTSKRLEDLTWEELRPKCYGVIKSITKSGDDKLTVTRLLNSDLTSRDVLDNCVSNISLNSDNNLVITNKTVSSNTDIVGLVNDVYVNGDGNLVFSSLTEDDLLGKSSVLEDYVVTLKSDANSSVTSSYVVLTATVKDYTDVPVTDVKVYFYDINGTFVGDAVTDNKGVATITIEVRNTALINDTITPTQEEFDGLTYGSTISFKLKDGLCSIIDYGYTIDTVANPGKVIEKDIDIPVCDKYGYQIEINYNNNSSLDINNLDGVIQVNCVEDTNYESYNTFYKDLICSPMRLLNHTCTMTRYSSEGCLYYYNYTDDYPSYVGSPFNQYKGGTGLLSELGNDILSLEEVSGVVYLHNSLIKIGFHKQHGFITLYTYNHFTKSYVLVNMLKIDEQPDISLPRSFNDDSCCVQFGESYWTLWRGKPYVEVKHENVDIRITNPFNRIYCEIPDGVTDLHLLEEIGVNNGIFETMSSQNLFKQELHIGENILLTNFKAYSDMVDGYYKDNKFYYDDTFKNVITPVNEGLYFDKLTNKSYVYINNTYKLRS